MHRVTLQVRDIDEQEGETTGRKDLRSGLETLTRDQLEALDWLETELSEILVHDDQRVRVVVDTGTRGETSISARGEISTAR